MRSSLLLLLLVGAVMSVRAQVSLSGQVRSAPPTAQPLAGVVIEAGRAKATTDEQGRYTLTLRRAKPGDLIRLQPERAGYALLTPTHQFVVIPPHGQQKRNLVMGVEANYSSLARNWHQATFEATLSQHYQDSLDQVPEGDARADLAQRFAAAQLAVNLMDDMFLSSDWQQTAEPFFAAFAAFPEQPGVVLRRLQEQQLAQQTQRALAGKRRKRQSPSPEALAQALRLRARAQVLSLQLTDAAESFRTALALDDRNALDLWESARFFQAIDQPEEAVRLYRLAMDRTRTPSLEAGLLLDLAEAQQMQGDTAAAQLAQEQALDQYQRLIEADPARFGGRALHTLGRLAYERYRQGNHSGARRALDRADSLWESLGPAVQPQVGKQQAYLTMLRGRIQAEADQPKAALTSLTKSIDLYRQLYQVDSVQHGAKLAEALSEYAEIGRFHGDQTRALAAHQEAVRLLAWLTEQDSTKHQTRYLTVLSHLPDHHLLRREPAKALSTGRQVLAQAVRLSPPDPQGYARLLADVWTSCAEAYAMQGQADSTQWAYQQAQQSLRGLPNMELEQVKVLLGQAQALSNVAPEQSLRLLQTAQQLLDADPQADDSDQRYQQARLHLYRGSLRLSQFASDAAILDLRQAAQLMYTPALTQLDGPRSILMLALANQAAAYLQVGQLDTLLPFAQQADSVFRQIRALQWYEDRLQRKTQIGYLLGLGYMGQGNLQTARKVFQRTLNQLQNTEAADAPWYDEEVADLRNSQGLLYLLLGEEDSAQQAFEAAYAGFERCLAEEPDRAHADQIRLRMASIVLQRENRIVNRGSKDEAVIERLKAGNELLYEISNQDWAQVKLLRAGLLGLMGQVAFHQLDGKRAARFLLRAKAMLDELPTAIRAQRADIVLATLVTLGMSHMLGMEDAKAEAVFAEAYDWLPRVPDGPIKRFFADKLSTYYQP